MTAYRYRFTDSSNATDFSDTRDLGTIDQAIMEAVRELTFMIMARLPDGDHRTFGVTVSDEGGLEVYRATMAFQGEKLGHATAT